MQVGEAQVEGDGGAFEAAKAEAVIVRHPKDPGAQIVHTLAAAENDIETQKDFLSGFLSLRRRQAEEKQVTIDVVAGLFEET